MKQLQTMWLCLLLGVGSAQGGRSDDRFAPVVPVDGAELTLRGQGVLRYKRIIPVYDAALYLPSDASSGQALERVPRRLEVVYRTDAKAKRFADAGDVVLARNFSPSAIRAIQERLDEINAWYPDPEKGDRCAITYVPGRGTELDFNGESLGWIEGDDFAEAYFSIWLGDRPASTTLRDDLLNPETIDER